MSPVLRTAQRAFDTIPLYRSLYGSRPEREMDVPYISPSAFHRAHGPLDAVTSADNVRGVVPAFSQRRRLPISVLESDEEWRLRRDRLRHALTIVGATPAAGLRFAIVTDETARPFASDVANFLAWDRAECSIVLDWTSPSGLEATLAALCPDIVLAAGASSAVIPHMRRPDRRLVTCIHVNDSHDCLTDVDRLLVSDEMFVMGAARANEAAYQFDGRSLLMETDPVTGRIAVTTTAFNCFALVRYRLDLASAGDAPNAAV